MILSPWFQRTVVCASEHESRTLALTTDWREKLNLFEVVCLFDTGVTS
jgi:hypothetical protein